MFNISDKVVCVAEHLRADTHNCPDGFPAKGGVYVVRGLYFGAMPDLGLMLVGFRAFSHISGNEVGFTSRKYRLLSEVQAENAVKNAVWSQEVSAS